MGPIGQPPRRSCASSVGVRPVPPRPPLYTDGLLASLARLDKALRSCERARPRASGQPVISSLSSVGSSRLPRFSCRRRRGFAPPPSLNSIKLGHGKRRGGKPLLDKKTELLQLVFLFITLNVTNIIFAFKEQSEHGREQHACGGDRNVLCKSKPVARATANTRQP